MRSPLRGLILNLGLHKGYCLHSLYKPFSPVLLFNHGQHGFLSAAVWSCADNQPHGAVEALLVVVCTGCIAAILTSRGRSVCVKPCLPLAAFHGLFFDLSRLYQGISLSIYLLTETGLYRTDPGNASRRGKKRFQVTWKGRTKRPSCHGLKPAYEPLPIRSVSPVSTLIFL